MKIAIVGPSGCGKTTIINKYIEKYGDFSVSKNITTRVKRHENDNEFIFVDQQEFERLIEEDFFFEYENIFNNYYGTPRGSLQTNNVFFNLDINGVKKLKNHVNDIIVIFIITVSREVLMSRLQNRKCNSNIEKRMQRIDEEISQHAICHYKIVNDDLDESVSMLRNIISIEKMRTKFENILHNF